MFVSCLCSRLAAEENEDEEEDEKILALRDDEDYLAPPGGYQPGHGYIAKESDELVEERLDRLKERKMWAILRELLVYGVFLVVRY